MLSFFRSRHRTAPPKQASSTCPTPSLTSSSASSSSLSSLASSSASSIDYSKRYPSDGELSSAPPQNSISVKLPRRKRKHLLRSRRPLSISPRLSSLFFPATDLTDEQEQLCVYKAKFAATSISVNDFGSHPETGSENQSSYPYRHTWCKQSNYTSLDLPSSRLSYSSPYSNQRNSQSFVAFGSHLNLHSSTNLGGQPDNCTAPAAQRVQRRKPVQSAGMAVTMERAMSSSTNLARTDMWASSYASDSDITSMPPPPIPARSVLRPCASTSSLRETARAQFTLPVDPPIASTMSPSFLRHSGLTSEPDATILASPPPMSPPATFSPNPNGESSSSYILGRKKRSGPTRGSISGDPNRVKDGAMPKESSSGVYTPPTFPGVQGETPKPPQRSTSRVYTPSTFVLPSAAASASSSASFPPRSPSRSASNSSTSTSSSLSEIPTPHTPRTPITPSNRFFGAVSGGWGSAVTGIKRASATLSTRSASATTPTTPQYAYTPTSARDGYFPSTIYEASHGDQHGTPLAPSPWPISPGSAGSGKPYGLGLGIDGQHPRSHARSDSAGANGLLVGDVPKGKRKPVPAASGQEEEDFIVKDLDAERSQIIHAM